MTVQTYPVARIHRSHRCPRAGRPFRADGRMVQL